MKETITTFINGLIQYDYILFGGVFALFILILILALVLRKRSFISGFLALLSFGVLFIGAPVGYIKMHEYLFPITVTIISQKRLHYSPAIVVKGELTNTSKKHDYATCQITTSVLRHSHNKLKNYLYQFKPMKKMSILEKDIRMGETRTFKIIIEPFNSSREYNLSIKAHCI